MEFHLDDFMENTAKIKKLKEEAKLKRKKELAERVDYIRSNRVKDTIELTPEQCYNGNIKLKKFNVKIPYTEEQIKEYLKCKEDIIYFVENYCEIVTLDNGLQPFILYEPQKKMIESFKDNRMTIALTMRQFGKTTTVAAFFVHQLCFSKDTRFALLANKGGTAKEILERIKEMFEHLPLFLKPGVVNWNKESIQLSNGVKCLSAATSSNSIRGKTINCLYLDEFGVIENVDEFFTSTYPVITSGESSKVIITSTPKGLNLFHKIWKEAELGINGFVPIRATWREHPERDEEWAAEQIKVIGERQFAQEFESVSYDTIININGVDMKIGNVYEMLNGANNF